MVILDRVQVSQRLRLQKLVAWQDALVISCALVASTGARVVTCDEPSEAFNYRTHKQTQERAKPYFFPPRLYYMVLIWHGSKNTFQTTKMKYETRIGREQEGERLFTPVRAEQA